MDPAKVNAILEWEPPVNIKDFQWFNFLDLQIFTAVSF